MNIKKMAVFRKVLAGAILGAALLISSPSASAAMALIYELDHRFSGATMPGPIPWATATFLQVDDNTVELHMRANNIYGGTIDNWWFNFNGSVSSLEVKNISGQGASSPTFATATQNTSLFNTGRDAIRWNFSFYGGAMEDKLGSGDDVWVSFYSASGLSVTNFDKSVNPGGGVNLYSGANVSGLAGGTEKIVDLAPRYDDIQGGRHFFLVPEASSLYLGFLLLSGAVGGELVRRKK